MTSLSEPTLDAAIEVLLKHGIRRTSMSDIAEAANVSRQTLYSRYENKEGIIRAVILYSTQQSIAEIETQWATSSTVGERLDVYFELALLKTFRLMQSLPDAEDLLNAKNPVVAEAVREAEDLYTEMLTKMLTSQEEALRQHQESASGVAGFIALTCYGIKHSATSEIELEQKLATLRRMVLLMVGES